MRLALAQMPVQPGQPETNLSTAESYIAEAAGQGADVVLLPECLDLGWTHPSARDLAGEIPDGESCRRLMSAAAAHGLFVCAGLVERCGESRFNSAVLIDPSGALLLHHRKIHELDFACEVYSTGDRFGVADTVYGTIGLMICADGFAPGQVISRSLAMMGARIILSPCAWAVPPDHDNNANPYGRVWLDNYCPVCREFGITIAGCSNVGPIPEGRWAGRKCIGSSMVIDGHGNRVALLNYDRPELRLIEWSGASVG